MEEATKIDISKLKTGFLGKFPSHPLSRILSSEPASLTSTEFLAKAQTWLAFFRGEKENE